MKKKVLIVDDSSTIRLIVETTLKKKYDVTAKENGLEAYKWIDNEGNIPDLIICDIQMPEMDGTDFVEQLRASGLYKNIPLIMLSGDEDSKTRIKFYKLKVKNFLTKPFNAQELAALVDLFLDEDNL